MNDAVGTCKQCSKGICHECITLVDNCVACASTCVEEVRAVNLLISQGKKSRTLVSSTYFRISVTSFLLGFLLIYIGSTQEVFRIIFLPMGAILLLSGVFTIYSGYRYRKR